jgi:small GTP-binding protein
VPDHSGDSLGDRVRAMRMRRGWPQQHLAKVAGLSARTVARIESGQPHSFATVLALAAAFDVEIGDLKPSPWMTEAWGATGGSVARRINWLHLSDLQMGEKGSHLHEPEIRDEFERDLRALHSVAGPWDVVIITGDLTRTGSPREYQVAGTFLDSLFEYLESLGPRPQFLAVPGNHDAFWPALRDSEEWATMRDVEGAFAAFMHWYTPRRPTKLVSGGIPGDFNYHLEKDGSQLGVVGLNSAFSMIGPGVRDDRQRVDHGFVQRSLAADTTDPWLILSHHPPSALDISCRNKLAEITANRAILHLTGETHGSSLALGSTHPGGYVFAVRSLFGPSGNYGYAAGSVDCDREQFLIWPRVFARTARRGFIAEPDLSFIVDADNAIVIPWRSAPAGGFTRSALAAARSQPDEILHHSFDVNGRAEDPAVWIAWAPDGSRLATGHENGTVNVWEAATNALIWSVRMHQSTVMDLAWSSDGLLLASISTDELLIWDRDNRRAPQRVHPGARRGGWAISWRPGTHTLVERAIEDDAHWWDEAGQEPPEPGFGDPGKIQALAWSSDGQRIAFATYRGLRIWNASIGLVDRESIRTMAAVLDLAWMPGSSILASAHVDGSVVIWDVAPDDLPRLVTLTGHSDAVSSISFDRHGKLLASRSHDGTIQLWRTDSWSHVETFAAETSRKVYPGLAFSPAGPILAASEGWNFRVWPIDTDHLFGKDFVPLTVHSTSAKVVLVGEGNVGKSCLALRLAKGQFEELDSTHGMKFWSIPATALHLDQPPAPDEEREVVLWDLGGQSEYRLIHQLFLKETTVALLVMEPRRGAAALLEIEGWIQSISKHEESRPVTKLLVGSKVDNEDAPIDRPGIDAFMRRHDIADYVPTSAKIGSGIDELKRALARSIDWANLGKTSQPELFRSISDEIRAQILALRVALPLVELEHILRDQDAASYDPEAIRTVVRQLATQGVLADTRLSDGTRTLILQVDYIDRYASSLVVMARDNPRGIAAIDLSVLLSPAVKLPRMKDSDRLRRDQELVVLDCVIQLLLEHGLCIRHEGLLVFPCLFQPTEHDQEFCCTVALYYDYTGPIENIYASLVTSLAISRQFGPMRLWDERAEFSRAGQGTAGVRKSHLGPMTGTARLDVYFDDVASEPTRDLFVGFVEDHLRAHGVAIVERLTMTCGSCRSEIPEHAVRARREKGLIDIACPTCDTRWPLTSGASEARDRSPDLVLGIEALKTSIEDQRRRTITETKVTMNLIHKAQISAGAQEPPIRILHLSDLHVTADADPVALLQPLVADLEDNTDGLGIDRLDFLVVSGDVTNRASPAEFEKAHMLISGIIDRFGLTAERCVIVPGNHDLDWNEPVYDTKKRRNAKPEELYPGRYKEQGELFEIRNDTLYPNRFRNFSQYFYHPLLQQPYPLPAEQQCVPILCAELGLQFFSLNSAWEIDEYFPERSGIHPGALARGLDEADRQIKRACEEGRLGSKDSVLRVAVWHHPVTGNEKIVDDAFMDRLRQADIRLCLHGHVHENRPDVVGYLHPTRRIHVVGGGSFGAPVHDRPESIPRLYNVIEIARTSRKLQVHTRCMRKQTSAWEGWAVWPGQARGEKRTYYEVTIP